jgi:hypothetical protein
MREATMQRRVPDVRLAALCVAAAALLLFGFGSPTAAFAEMLNGNIGASAEWGSSWMDFGQAANFIAGEKLKITLKRGGAQRVLVRLLPYGTSPDEPVGIIGNQPIPVQDGTVTVTLDKNYSNIRQLSVHGGEKAWEFSLGAGNGPAEILSVDLSK